MRTIKFRAWDAESKKMFSAQDLSQARIYWDWLGLKDVKLMQYTGLKDKNGKEIYEGDIIMSIYGTGHVVYHERKALFGHEVKGSYGEFVFIEIYRNIQETEVIGNIYENPELQEQEK